MILVQIFIILPLTWFFSSLQAHFGFIIVAMFSMILFCLMMYGAARISARSKLARLYIQLIMIAVFLKMLVCLALIIGYKRGFDPADNHFVWPFLIIYITSTIYEVIFLDKVGREKQIPEA